MYVFMYVGRRGILQQLQKVPESVFYFLEFRDHYWKLGQCRNKKHNCNFMYCSQSKHAIVYYKERKRKKKLFECKQEGILIALKPFYK